MNAMSRGEKGGWSRVSRVLLLATHGGKHVGDDVCLRWQARGGRDWG
jgi:hypothetical protein